MFQKMKTTFGMHSRLLVINSQKYASTEAYPASLWSYLNEVHHQEPGPEKDQDSISPSPSSLESFHPLEDTSNDSATVTPRGQFLSTKDVEGLSAFVREFSTQSVIPFMEKNIANWNETIAASRRGITGRLFSASKKYFNSGAKAPSPAAGSGGAPTYHYSSPEAQLRKLADYAFMLQDYRFALGIYDTVKKDYVNDKAAKHAAGAQVRFRTFLISVFFISVLVLKSFQLDHRNSLDSVRRL